MTIGAIKVQRIIESEEPFMYPTDICAEATPDNLSPHLYWNAVFDWDPALSRATRRSFLETCCGEGRLVLTAHFPLPSIGHIREENDAFRFRYVKN